jgi:hypothetical protein
LFNRTIIDENIEKANIHLIQTSPFNERGRPIFQPGFSLQYHSVSQVAQANAHFDELLCEEGEKGVEWDGMQLERPLNAEETRWVINERTLCRLDFEYWATRYAFIIDYEGRLVRFNPNVAQKMALDAFSELNGEGVAMLYQFLKARRLGVTTLTELIVFWMATSFPRTLALVASSRPEKSAEMAEIIIRTSQNLPYWLIPRLTGYHGVSEGSGVFDYARQNSKIQIRHGAQMSGLGRGGSPKIFHISEICEISNAEDLIEASLLRAVIDTPETFGILESTALGRNNYWYKKWTDNVAKWPMRRCRMCPQFLPWYVGTDIYPAPAWTKAHPIPKNHEFDSRTLNHARRAKEYVQSGNNPLVTKFLGSNWEMPPEQMYFWEITRAESESLNNLHTFYAELCGDDQEAFQNANISIYNIETLEAYRNNCRMPVGVYGLQAPQTEVPVELQPLDMDIDRRRPYIDIHADWNPTGKSHDYRLVPLLHRGSLGSFNPDGKIIMYEKPEQYAKYGIGTDTGFGLGKDRSAIEVLRAGDNERNDEQVLEFASPYVNSFNLWPFNLAIGTLYSYIQNGMRRQPRQVIEMAANGENVQHELRKRGWREFHPWLRYNKKKLVEAKATGWGWWTVPWSRRMMMDMFLDATMNGWLDINSPWFVDEMADLELELETQKLKASDGKKDDRIMALGIVLFSIHVNETKAKDGWTSREKRSGEESAPQYARYGEGEQGTAPAYPGESNGRLDSYIYRV